jgi:hypothetical protein
MNNIDWFNTEFVRRYGTVKRARGCYWYTEKGVRLVDLWQEDGRAILGWGACNAKAFEVLKNAIARGQTGSFPTDYTKSFTKAVLQLVNKDLSTQISPDLSVTPYQYVSLITDISVVRDLPVWRPWFSVTAPVILVQIPFAWTESVYVVVSEKPFVSTCANNSMTAMLPVSGAYLAAATRAVYSLIAQLDKREECHFKRFDSSLKNYFTRTGPYLSILSDKMYKEFVLHCLDCEVVINPDATKLSIVPFGANPGDFRKLDRAPFSL